jgi:hypothetical protein
MAAGLGIKARGKRNVLAATLSKFRAARRSAKAGLGGGKPSLWIRFGARERGTGPDPVSLAVFAIDHVGPAAVRACASGIEVRIAAQDEATAAVIRAALAETARHRPTDRLIQVMTESNRI